MLRPISYQKVGCLLTHLTLKLLLRNYVVKYSMRIDIITLFPKMFRGPFEESILKRAQEKHLVEIHIHDLRDWAKDKHKTVDDKPYGGGPGMILRVDVVDSALKDIKSKSLNRESRIILLSPQGKVFNQDKAKAFSKLEHLILVAGHYEGFDERIRENLIDDEVSIGNFVLTGGEIPAMVVTDAVVRLLPNVLGDEESLKDETHSKPGYKKYPVYTRPEIYQDWKVPDVLLSGDHNKIEEWKKKQSRN